VQSSSSRETRPFSKFPLIVSFEDNRSECVPKIVAELAGDVFALAKPFGREETHEPEQAVVVFVKVA
jgi:hypothetical protein